MKIKKIEFENFRNFKEKNIIEFSTDGKVNIIYGLNGDGKTTLHQLFQWLFYDKLNFNKTTTDKIYNHEFEREVAIDSEFSVMGKVDFEHNGEDYTLMKEHVFKRKLLTSNLIETEFILNKKTGNNWNRIKNPKEVVEDLIPEGLSQYFFFDGENMIADLKVKGRDSAKTLKNALYSIFDLNVYENAVQHIGDSDRKTTAIGSLYLAKESSANEDVVGDLREKIEGVQNLIADLEQKERELLLEKSEHSEKIKKLSEEIGSMKSSSEYEVERNRVKRDRDNYLNLIVSKKKEFGANIMSIFPNLLISKVVIDAKKKLKLTVDNNKLVTGVSTDLVNALLKEDVCLCGNKIGEKEKSSLNDLFKLLPPLSFQGLYDNFTKDAQRHSKKFNLEIFNENIKDILDYRDVAKEYDQEIYNINEKMKLSKDVQPLIIARSNSEERIRDIDRKLNEFKDKKTKSQLFLKKNKKSYENNLESNEANKQIDEKIKLLEDVKIYFEHKLKQSTVNYSNLLEKSIQSLLNDMLTSTRNVSIDDNFYLKVFDSYQDESKSEGQFAVVSFAYIAGILKVLKEENMIKQKEYPLILDGPFSKLDPIQKQNVIDTLPKYASQIILFSKDSLQSNFDEGQIGKVYTIESNDEKNVALVKEGFLWK